MTYSASYAPFVPELTWMFLRPIGVAGAIALAVDYFIWPDDSINNFLGVTRKTLAGYNAFFKEHSEGFLSNSSEKSNATLPSLNARLQNGILLMIDSKRAVKREITYSRISDVDCSKLCKLITNMRPSLHSIGLSLIMKDNYINTETKNMYFKNFSNDIIVDAFTSSIEGIRPVCIELTNLCVDATNQISNRVGNLHYHPRTTLNSILWPFPRIWVSKPKSKQVGEQQQQQEEQIITSTQLRQIITKLDEVSKSNQVFSKFLDMKASDIPRNGPLYLIFLYLYNLHQHASKTAILLEAVENIERNRTKARFWLPHQTLKKWLTSSSEAESSVGGDQTDYENQHAGNDLVRVATRGDGRPRDDEEDAIFKAKPDPKKKPNLGDPDVSAPVTSIQKFFYGLYLLSKWLTDTTTFFAFKTAVGVVLLAIPAWRAQDATWYQDWRGQWAMITLVLWMFPMTGAFIFGIIDRIVGSVVGAILGIVVWEISRGNPYGLAILCFIIFIPLYHLFFFVQRYRVIALMSKVTMLIVIAYEYTYVIEQVPNYDQVYTVAGKRLLLVVIGITASGILIAIPFLPTSRVELRKRLARTVRDIGKCYGILSTSVIHPIGHQPTPAIEKSFRKLAIELRRQVAEEHTLFHHTAYEPSFRGYYPSESYRILVEKMDNMSDLVVNMVKTYTKHHLRDIKHKKGILST
ncbi:Fusaric acid resistance protein-like-domain-containing protein [Gilbertella persicaria]|uniref:Fusaric acid resistance protein-like-domain-containing protein n=1 Tax=Gilbertella persicaria TaxID=101096 RepID=UPI002220470D|nr:Fusaric acid resistance protein-like-domain-containing protein [Gilbertella persicaria]KAI8081921.1 Fusaric acid resistance protein-like-domain-containing protein [Gilbertella persicaria]